MRRTALVLILAGFVFAFFSLPLLGIDIFIDAVGFLLMANGVWAFRKLAPVFKPAAALCLALMLTAALQLFWAGSLLAPLRGIMQAALFALFALGFPMMDYVRRRPAWRWGVMGAFAACGGLALADTFLGLPPLAAALWQALPPAALLALTLLPDEGK